MNRNFLEAAYSQKKNKVFFQGNEVITYGELLDAVERLTTLYANRNISPGDHLLLAIKDPVKFTEIAISVLSNGIGAIIADPEARPSEILNQIKQTKPDGLIIDNHLYEELSLASLTDGPPVMFRVAEKSNAGGLFGRLLGSNKSGPSEHGYESYPELKRNYERTRPHDDYKPELTGWVIHTSGTTSNPKNVIASRRALLNTLACRSENYGVTESSCILNVLPLSQGDGLGQGPLLAAYNGATWVRPVEFQQKNLPTILDAVYTYHVSHFVTVPVIMGLMLRIYEDYQDCFNTENFKYVISTAAALQSSLWSEFEKKFGVEVVNVYALSECTTALFNGPDPTTRRIGALGKPYNCDIKIVSEDGSHPSTTLRGELWLRGPSIMDGYMNNPIATSECLTDGWLRTGDLVEVDSDGFIVLVGRLKEMISFGGHSISPAEISQVLENHHSVIESAVIGVPHDEWGEIAIAFVALESGDQLTEAQLVDYAREYLSDYKLPRKIIFIDSLPRTKTGKFDQRALTELHDHQVQRSSGGPLEQVIAIAKAIFRTDQPIGLDSSPETTMGWDSLAHMEMVLSVEKAFSVTFTTREIMTIETIGSVVKLVNSKLSEV